MSKWIWSSLVFVSMILSCQQRPHVNQKSSPPTECDKAELNAENDIKNKTMKYYTFGISNPDKEYVQRLKSLDITVVSLSCIKSPEYDCYNEKIEHHIKDKFNQDIKN